jgi:hypothetical protein
VDFEGKEYAFDLRLVKIDLPKGKTEILITNLPKTEFSRLDIGELYNYRWRIETAFLDLKYAVHVEEFMSKKENSIKQEFYASLIQANFAMLFMGVANQVIASKKRVKVGVYSKQAKVMLYCSCAFVGFSATPSEDG